MISRVCSTVLFLTLLASTGCGAHEASLAPDAQPLWSQCESTLQRYCRDRSEQSPNAERDCIRDWRNRYAALGDDAARHAFVAGSA